MQTAADFTHELYEAFECELVGKPLIEATIKDAQWDHAKTPTSIMLTLEDGQQFQLNIVKVNAPQNPSER